MRSITLTGLSGQTYTFSTYPAMGTSWNAVPGLYAFADYAGWPKYIGESKNLHSRNPGPSHECWAEAQTNGASIILAMVCQGPERDRLAVEADLIRAYDPPVNKQMRLRSTGDLARALLGAQPQGYHKTLISGG